MPQTAVLPQGPEHPRDADLGMDPANGTQRNSIEHDFEVIISL